MRIRDLDSRSALRHLAENDPAWDVLDRLVGGDLFALLKSNKAFSEVHEIAAKGVQFIDGSWQKEVRDLVGELKASLKLDALFGRLERIDTKDKLNALADEQLQGLVEKILGRSFDQIRNGHVGKLLKELRETLDRIDRFKNKFADVLQKSYEQSVSLAINYAYSRSSSRKALIDMEFDVSEERGRKPVPGGGPRKVQRGVRQGQPAIHEGPRRTADAHAHEELDTADQCLRLEYETPGRGCL